MSRPPAASHRPPAASAPDAFAGALARLDDRALTMLLAHRPDLADPPPADLADLFVRASTPQSVYRAVDHLDRPACELLRAVTAVGGTARPAQLAPLLGAAATSTRRAATEAATARAASLLLLAVGDDGTLHAHPTVGRILPGTPLGPPLRRLLQELTVDELRWVARHRPTGAAATRKAQLVDALAGALADPDGIRAAVAAAPPEAAALARRLAQRPVAVPATTSALYPRYATGRATQPRDAAQWLAWHGLVVRNGWYQVVMPREVALALHDGPMFDVAGDPPAVEPAGPPAPAGADLAAAAAAELVAHVEHLVEAVAAAPTALRKSGALGVRQLRRLAKATGLPERRAAFVVELAAAAGLLGQVGATWDGTAEVLPTAAYDQWCDHDPAPRWVALVAAWLTAERLLGAAGAQGPDRKPLAALDGPPTTEATRQRQVVLQVLADLPDGVAATRPSLVAAARWRAPLAADAGPAPTADLVGWVLDEAAALGLVHHGGLSPLGRHVVAGDLAAAADAVADHAGRLSCDLVLQGDLTAVAPAATPRAFRQRMELVADVESKGATVVYRFGDASVRRGFDAGLTADDILGFLAQHATTPVPQPLAYLVGDVARRHGTLRVGHARSYVRGADEATVADLLRNRRTAHLGLRALSGTVLVGDAEPDAVADALRAAGYLPAREDADGQLVVARPDRRRATDPAGSQSAVPLVDPATAADLARRLLAVPRTVDARSLAGRWAALGPPAYPASSGHGPWSGGAWSGDDAWADEAWSGDDGFDDDPALADGPAGAHELAAEPARLVAARAAGAPRGQRAGGRSLDGVPGDAPLADLVGAGVEAGPCGCRRRTDIARDRDGVGSLLVDAMAHEWTVRVAVTRRRQKPAHSFFAEVEDVDVDTGQVTLWSHERDETTEVPLSSVAWARVLTVAEEEALFSGVMGR